MTRCVKRQFRYFSDVVARPETILMAVPNVILTLVVLSHLDWSFFCIPSSDHKRHRCLPVMAAVSGTFPEGLLQLWRLRKLSLTESSMNGEHFLVWKCQ